MGRCSGCSSEKGRLPRTTRRAVAPSLATKRQPVPPTPEGTGPFTLTVTAGCPGPHGEQQSPASQLSTSKYPPPRRGQAPLL